MLLQPPITATEQIYSTKVFFAMAGTLIEQEMFISSGI